MYVVKVVTFYFCRYWHRSLNPKKLIEVQFSHLSRNMTMQRQIKLLKLPENTKIEGLRALTSADVPGACKLLNEVISRKFTNLICHLYVNSTYLATSATQ